MASPDEKMQQDQGYRLDDQVGYLLRLASQRHAAIFQRRISEALTATQFATLMRISEHGHASQNHLGRMAAMDVATIKGVVDRLKSKGLVESKPDPNDKRRTNIFLTDQGTAIVASLTSDGLRISQDTLAPLSPSEQKTLLGLLKKLT